MESKNSPTSVMQPVPKRLKVSHDTTKTTTKTTTTNTRIVNNPADLNEHTFQHILSFLELKPAELFPIAATCKAWLGYIETHCEEKIQGISKSHPHVDEDAFQKRISEYFSKPNKDKNTTKVPHRCRWQAAHNVHLYQVGFHHQRGNVSLHRRMELSSSTGEFRLLVQAGPNAYWISVWNVRTNSRHHASVKVRDDVFPDCFWMDYDQKLFVAASNKLVIMDLVQMKAAVISNFLSQQAGTNDTWVKKDEKTMICALRHRRKVLSLDVCIQRSQEIGQIDFAVESSIGISPNKRWLFVRESVGDEGERICILDLRKECLLHDVMDAQYNDWGPILSHRDPKVIFGFRGPEGRFLLFDEGSGELFDETEDVNFREWYPDYADELYLVDTNQQKLRLLDLDTASPKRVLKLPSGMKYDNFQDGFDGSGIQPTEKEIFVNVQPIDETTNVAHVAAYLR